MEIKQSILDKSKYSLKCPHNMNPKFIIVHNTANDASAKNEVSYMKNNSSSTSFHIAIDDIEAIQVIPFDRNTWNSGDGGNGNGNRNGISIEICYSKSGGERWEKAKANAVEVIVQLLKQYGWGIEQVKKHQDFNGKYCPHRILDEGWENFLNLIRERLVQHTPDLQYKAHIQDLGWTDWKNAGEIVGTVGENKRIEAIAIQANNGVDIQYKVHMEGIGWSDWKHSGEVAGTEGESRRIEAIEIQSNKALEAREQVQDIGWMPFSRGTAVKIGTETKGLRLEAFVISVV